MKNRFGFYEILVLNALFLSVNCEWIEIPQEIPQENIYDTSLDLESHYTFPRNQYVYKKPTQSKEKISFTPKPTITTQKYIDDSTLKTTSSSKTDANPLPPPKVQDRMDDSEEINSEKLVGTTGKPQEDEKETQDDAKKSGDSFIPFLKTVQDELVVKGRKNLKGKINMLMNLRDDLLLNIDERISKLWGGKTKQSSEAREHKEDDHDMHFPSNEGALMTIGFLTFAVFLIKLVLKLVQALKDKHSMVMVTPTVMTNAAFIGRKKRDADFEEQKKVLQFIDEYNFT